MLSKRARKSFAEIAGAVDLIRGWIDEAGGVDQAIHDNVLVRSGIERQLLVISEAAIRLDRLDPSLAAALAPEIDWPGVRGIGNFIRHRYDDLDRQIVIDVLNHRLHALKVAAERALAQPPAG